MSRRVVVTGVGAVSPVGNDVRTSWQALLAGKSGVSRLTLFDPSALAVQIGGQVKDLDTEQFIEAKDLRRMDRNVQFAVVATGEALQDAKLAITPENSEEVGCIIGSAIGGIKTLLDSQKTFDEKGPSRVSPFFLQNLIPDTASGQVAITFGAKGPNLAVVSACATGAHAIGEATETIRRGDATVMLAGGTEAAIVPVVVAGFTVMRALAQNNDSPETASRPFDLTREGFVMAEGCAMLILEELEHALARDAHIYCEVAGYGSTNDAFHLAAPAENGEGAARAMSVAIRRAGLAPTDVDYINAHGTGTPLNDKYETAAIKTAFGDHAYRLAVSSTKSMTGHMMGAAGAFELMVCALALCHQVIPPTINYRHPDPDCDLDYVPNEARAASLDVVMSNSLGLGGHNGSLILRRPEF
ncbi:MAG TPA: beta-ketoacyl-ACP synthase II [Chloroflexota bacterium]|nr:beta-ketoacyl-ACP synthase II [Chloroflexota bacterium]